MLQRVIDFCHEHKIVPRIKMVTANDLDRVYDELNKKNDTILRSQTYDTIYIISICYSFRNVLDIEASI